MSIKYEYKGNFIPQETQYKPYSPNEMQAFFYCSLFPEILDGFTGESYFGGEVIRARISPVSVSEVKIAGHKNTFRIYEFNSEFALLENTKNKKNKERFLISLSEITNRNLQTERRE